MTMKEYTIDDCEGITNDIMNMAMFLNSGACADNAQIHNDVLEAMFGKLESLQGMFMLMKATKLGGVQHAETR